MSNLNNKKNWYFDDAIQASGFPIVSGKDRLAGDT